MTIGEVEVINDGTSLALQSHSSKFTRLEHGPLEPSDTENRENVCSIQVMVFLWALGSHNCYSMFLRPSLLSGMNSNPGLKNQGTCSLELCHLICRGNSLFYISI